MLPNIYNPKTTLSYPHIQRPSTGLIPLTDLGTAFYCDMQGGLYPMGSNEMPEQHKEAGLRMADIIQPLDKDGQANPHGQIVFLAVGMSNTGLYFDTFRALVTDFEDLNLQVLMVNGALEGKDISNVLTHDDPYWRYVLHRLKGANASPLQVQAIWFMQAQLEPNIPPDEGLQHIESMCEKYIAAMLVLRFLFPNLKQVFSSGREYGGYGAPNKGNPEPYAYYTGWAWKRIIERQIQGDPRLEFEGLNAKTAWLAWSNYFWADGVTPRSDGLTWIYPDDFEADGVHPSPSGKQKAGQLIQSFFLTSQTTSWFRKK